MAFLLLVVTAEQFKFGVKTNLFPGKLPAKSIMALYVISGPFFFTLSKSLIGYTGHSLIQDKGFPNQCKNGF